jgi:hypothetical protein
MNIRGYVSKLHVVEVTLKANQWIVCELSDVMNFKVMDQNFVEDSEKNP